MPLLPYDYLHLVNCPEVVIISDILCTCGDLYEECDCDCDGEDEHGEYDHLETLLAVVALPEAVGGHVTPGAASQEHGLNKGDCAVIIGQ